MTKDQLFSWSLPESMAQWQWDQYQYTALLGYYAPDRGLLLMISRKLDPSYLSGQAFHTKLLLMAASPWLTSGHSLAARDAW